MITQRGSDGTSPSRNAGACPHRPWSWVERPAARNGGPRPRGTSLKTCPGRNVGGRPDWQPNASAGMSSSSPSGNDGSWARCAAQRNGIARLTTQRGSDGASPSQTACLGPITVFFEGTPSGGRWGTDRSYCPAGRSPPVPAPPGNSTTHPIRRNRLCANDLRHTSPRQITQSEQNVVFISCTQPVYC
jgi:hypothetical protein